MLFDPTTHAIAVTAHVFPDHHGAFKHGRKLVMTVGGQHFKNAVEPVDDLRKLVFGHAVASLSETSLVCTRIVGVRKSDAGRLRQP